MEQERGDYWETTHFIEEALEKAEQVESKPATICEVIEKVVKLSQNSGTDFLKHCMVKFRCD